MAQRLASVLSILLFYGGETNRGRKMKIGSIVVRCYEFDKMLAFW